jgi:hypothetical protein
MKSETIALCFRVALSIVCSAAIGVPVAAAQDAHEEALERDLAVVQKPLFEFGTASSSVGTIPLEASVDRRRRIYRIGDRLRIEVRPRQDAYITVLDIGSSGRVAVLFPNYFQRDMKVKARRTVTIPAARSRWTIQVSGPTGVDLIKVIASAQPVTLRELEELPRTTADAPAPSLGRSAEDVARDLNVVATVHPTLGVRNILIRIVD